MVPMNVSWETMYIGTLGRCFDYLGFIIDGKGDQTFDSSDAPALWIMTMNMK